MTLNIKWSKTEILEVIQTIKTRTIFGKYSLTLIHFFEYSSIQVFSHTYTSRFHTFPNPPSRSHASNAERPERFVRNYRFCLTKELSTFKKKADMFWEDLSSISYILTYYTYNGSSGVFNFSFGSC